MDFVTLLILGLATWRLASLFAREAGPWDVLIKFRSFLGVKWDAYSNPEGTTMLSKMIICVWCNSVWFGGFWTMAYLLSPTAIWLALPFAVSAGAVIIDCLAGDSYGRR